LFFQKGTGGGGHKMQKMLTLIASLRLTSKQNPFFEEPLEFIRI